MRRFLVGVIGFLSAVLVAAVAVLCLVPYSGGSGYHFLQGPDTHKSRWVFCRLFVDPAPVDVAFIGTSHTYLGVDDALLSQSWSTEQSEVAAVNLAFPGRGRSHHVSVVNDLLQRKRPRVVVVEVLEREARQTHPIGPVIASNGEFLRGFSPVNPGLMSDLGQFYRSRKANLRKMIDGPANSAATACERTESGTPFDPPDTTLTQDQMDQASERLQALRRPVFTPEAWWGFEFHASLKSLDILAEQVHAAGASLVFLYLPYYNAPPRPHPYFAERYERLGSVLYPPQSLIEDYGNWSDGDHLNARGAHRLSTWIARELPNVVAGGRLGGPR